MTINLRDEFAGRVLQGMCANPFLAEAAFEEKISAKENQERYARACYQFADAMMNQRGVKNEK